MTQDEIKIEADQLLQYIRKMNDPEMSISQWIDSKNFYSTDKIRILIKALASIMRSLK